MEDPLGEARHPVRDSAFTVHLMKSWGSRVTAPSFAWVLSAASASGFIPPAPPAEALLPAPVRLRELLPVPTLLPLFPSRSPLAPPEVFPELLAVATVCWSSICGMQKP